MRRWNRVALLFAVLSGCWLASASTNAEEKPDAGVYEAFRDWALGRPEETTDEELLAAYRDHLVESGLGEAEARGRIEWIRREGEAQETERWNRILTAEHPRFNTDANAFLVEQVAGLTPGRALDVGMGQGRNALWLASRGWRVTGFDPADEAVAAAVDQANAAGLSLQTHVAYDHAFDFGTDRWDLIVLSYVSLRHLLARIEQSLAPGGYVIVEAFHRDATKSDPIGGGVVFDSNELLELFAGYRVLVYEDSLAEADFGPGETRVVRLLARKPL